MKAGREIDLTSRQRQALFKVFSPYAERVEVVGVYGSRTQGRARPGSDVDLVIYGELAPGDLAAMRSDLEESDLSIFADVIDYGKIEHRPLKAQVDHWMKPLFTRHDLLAARTAEAA